ncbi:MULTISPECIES: glycosyltransferase family 2 protein [Methylomonas]|uniref:Glycosyltransferase 2-like domain-containing protein n=1 Tax=Methylomonas koyamae TaxID=702114 RepID=A0A177NN18_9GAMM|nr:glycosyltransferase family 2 protein [Methylomonas koyamae]OAI18599.1 hypothetical protein A1355_05645 [Methylomonas koyamae]
MKISAVIPAYNNAAFLRAAIASVRNQSHQVDEIIVVDDGSVDNTETVIADLGSDIVYHRQDNQGPSAARNQGISLANGDWIAFLDADDQWTPDKIAKQLQVLQTHPALRLIAGDMAEIDTDNRLLTASVLDKHGLSEKFSQLAGAPVPNALAALVAKNFIPTGTVLVSKAALYEACLFNPTIRFGEDLELWAKIAAKHPISCLPDTLMLRRQHGNNATQASERMLVDLTRVMDSLARQIGPELRAQGVSPDDLVSRAFWTLGYWYFNNGARTDARSAFRSSLTRKANAPALLYLIASQLTPGAIAAVRAVKQRLIGH